MTIRKWLAGVAVVAGTSLAGFAADPTPAAAPVAAPKPAADLSFGTLRAMPQDAAKAKVEGYLKAAGKLDQAQVDAIFAKADRTLLDRTVDAIGLANPDARKAIADARAVDAVPATEVPAAIKGEKDAFAKANLSAAFAKALGGKRVYEEALEAAKGLPTEQLVDPSAFFFFKSVAEHALTKREDAVKSIVSLLDDVTDAPDRYKMVATLMFFDIQNWSRDPKDLSNIEKLMDNSGRRLDLARGGQTTQDIQKKIVFRLDEKIKELENQEKGNGNGGSCPDGGDGTNKNINPSGPAKKSNLPGNNPTPGKVDDKQLRKYAEVWGSMPPAERAKAIAEITKDMPAKYKPMITQYFKSLNEINGFKD